MPAEENERGQDGAVKGALSCWPSSDAVDAPEVFHRGAET
jgi:hypothetical protein